MKSFHINIGNQFAQPYESTYATLRRCLIVNPGIPLSAIEINLRNTVPEGLSMTGRLSSLQNRFRQHVDDALTEQSHLQCPQCARHLYHTNIYTLPWLTHCPIHHCKFTTICPVCHQQWPLKNMLAKRDCPGCGMLSIAELKEYVLPTIKTLDYQPIIDIYKFIRDKDYPNSSTIRLCDISDLIYNFWWKQLPMDDDRFPSCQAHVHPSFSAKNLERLHISTNTTMRYKSSRIIPVDESYIKSKQYKYDNYPLDMKNVNKKNLKSDFKVMQHILTWISKHTPRHHKSHIISYYGLNSSCFLLGRDPCPYCLALSLWFIETTAKKYGYYYANKTNNYPFFYNNGFNGFYDFNELYLTLDYDNKFYLDNRFTRWFYRRSLEVSFLNILRHAFYFTNQLYCYRKNIQGKFRPKLRFNEVFPEQLYFNTIIDERLFFYYENEHPLDAYKPPTTKSLCHDYECNHATNQRVPSGFDWKFETTEFSYDTFLSLHERFIIHFKKTISPSLRGPRKYF